MEQWRASTAPFVRQIFKGVFRKNPPAQVRTETWDVKVIYFLQSWGKLLGLSYTWLILKVFQILTIAVVKKPSDLNLSKIISKAMQVNVDLITFQLGFRFKNAQPDHLKDPP